MASAGYCGFLCYPSVVKRLLPLWSNPVPLSLIWCTRVVPLFLGCYVIHHMVLIALKTWRVLRLPLRSCRLSNRISQFRFDTPTQSVSWSSVVLRLDEGLQSSLFFPPLRPTQLILWIFRPLFVLTVSWTSPQGYPPLGCDRSWLVGLRLVPVCSGNECPYVWSVSVVPDLLLRI